MSPSWKRTLIIAALVTLVTVAYRVWSEVAGPRFEEELADLAKIEADAKSKLPIKIDQTTTFVDLKYEPKKTVYWYVIDVPSNQQIDTNELEKNIRSYVCANSESSRSIREKGFSFEYHYLNKAKTPLATFTVAKCP